MKNLELECMNCREKITLPVSDEDYDCFQRTGSLIEGSEAYKNLFWSHGWVLQQMPFCDLCKYVHSEVYRN